MIPGIHNKVWTDPGYVVTPELAGDAPTERIVLSWLEGNEIRQVVGEPEAVDSLVKKAFGRCCACSCCSRP